MQVNLKKPEILELYARIFEMRKRHFDEKLNKFYWVDAGQIELAAAEALIFQAKFLRENPQ